MPVDSARVKSLFLAASEITDSAERAAYLERECAGDIPLRQRVEILLQANDEAPPALEQSVAATVDSAAGAPPTRDYTDSTARIGSHLAGKYKLVEEIGVGGMGTVFLAQQTEPVKRTVAVKLVKAGMDSRAFLARFEAERQALALMDHPNIAKVLDAGTTEGGRPFFVMELVRGVPITQFCDERRLSPRERLELFVPVCQAIQHAHQKGIIHRDIKPSNVLVALYDDRAVPKVIDFGVAKATGSLLTEASLLTGFGAVVGTPEYMSPEQAQLNNLDIDSRSDVYSLGVLLYELLTGTTPVDRQSLQHAAILEILRIVREVEAPRLSVKLSSIATLASVAANRNIEPARLSKMMSGELDWVVIKALEKERSRRYETANALARDIQRYLADEMVEARPPSAGYRLRKFVRKNRAAITSAAAVAVLLVAGITGTTWGLLRARQAATAERIAKEEADARRLEAELQQVRAETGEREAQREKRIAQAVKDFLQNKLLGQADAETQADALLRAGRKSEEVRRNPTIRDLLDRAADELAVDKIEESFPNQPLVQAEILETVGNSYRGVGESERAIEFLQRSYALRKQHSGPQEPDTLRSLHRLAEAESAAGKKDRATQQFESVAQLRTMVLGPQHPDTLTSNHDLAYAYLETGKQSEAERLCNEVLKLRQNVLGPDHPDTLETLGALAIIYQSTGNLRKALPLHEETVRRLEAAVGAEHPLTMICRSNLALAHQEYGRVDRAIPLYQRMIELKSLKLGDDHPETLTSKNNLGEAYRLAGKLDLALPLLEKTHELQRSKLGVDHPSTISSMHNLALVLTDVGKIEEAVSLSQTALELAKSKLGADHPSTMQAMSSLALAYKSAGKPDQALQLLQQAIELQRSELGPEHPVTLISLHNLASVYRDLGKLDLAVPLLEKTVELEKKNLGEEHPTTLGSMHNLAAAYQEGGQLDRAVPMYEETLRLRRASPSSNPTDTLKCMNALGVAYWQQRRLDKSIPLFEETLTGLENLLGREPELTQWTVANLGVNYKDVGRIDDALPLLKEAFESAKKYPKLRWVGRQLLDAYLKVGDKDKLATVLMQELAYVREAMSGASPEFAGVLAETGLNLLNLDLAAAAEPVLRESLAIREQHLPDSWLTFNTHSLLGGALLGQQKYAEAESHLLKGLEGMQQRATTIPAEGKIRLREARSRLIELYTALDKPDEVQKWRAEL